VQDSSVQHALRGKWHAQQGRGMMEDGVRELEGGSRMNKR
jgi:hypothetical protein